MTLTTEDLQILRNPFQSNEHEFNRGWAYITEAAICDRIEMVDPGWQFEIITVIQRDDQITVTARMTIKNTSRDSTGMSKILTGTKVDQKTGEVEQFEVNEAEKSAVTDALKRCARLFGVGRYLLNLPKDDRRNPLVTNTTALAKWLESEFRPDNTKTQNTSQSNEKQSNSRLNGNQVQTAAPPSESATDEPEALFDMANVKPFKGWVHDKLELDENDIAKSFQQTFEKSFSEMAKTLTRSQIIGVLVAWICEYDVAMIEQNYSQWPEPVQVAAKEYAVQYQIAHVEF